MNKVIISAVLVIILIQLIPVDRDNPFSESTDEITVVDSIKTIIEHSCYNCHSNNTNWPWYSYVAPVSWMVAYHVHTGRGELNFSEWNSYDEKRKMYKLKELTEEIEEDEMPLISYRLMHPDAELSAQQKRQLTNWALSYTTINDSTHSE